MPTEFQLAGISALVLFIIGLFLVTIFFYITLQQTLEVVDPDCRKMTPGQVWLNLIPLFSLGWSIHTVISISDSLRCEFRKYNMQVPGEPGTRRTGMSYCILNIISLFLPDILKTIVGLATLICLIIYWVEINGYRKKLRDFKATPNAYFAQQYQYQQQQFQQQEPVDYVALQKKYAEGLSQNQQSESEKNIFPKNEDPNRWSPKNDQDIQ